MPIASINYILGLLTVGGHIFLVFVLFMLTFEKSRKVIVETVGKRGLVLAFLTVTAATVMSLFYSDVVGFEPCKLCWFQRIFMYPQVVLLGMALAKKEKQIIDYALTLTIIGAVIALYHNYIYFGGTSIFPCSAFGLGVSCTKRFIFEFGYVTLPMMSFTAFAFAILFLALQRQHIKSVRT